MRRGVALGLLAGVVAGCGARYVPPDPAEDVGWAIQRVECQRAVKRQLIAVDPIERRIEAHLNGDPRVASARFAIIVAYYGTCGPSDFEPLSFATVIKTRQPMAESEMRQLLHEACAAAGGTMSFALSRLARDGDTWGLGYATLSVHGEENPDLSNIPAAR